MQTISNLFSRTVTVLALGLPWVLSMSARGDVSFALTPASSALTLSGDAGGFPVTQQSAGSLITHYSGPLVLSNQPWTTSFQIVSADMTAANSGAYQPGVGGAAGTAQANYGGVVNLGVFGNAYLAACGLHVGLTSGPLTLSGGGPSGGGSFAVSGITATITAGVSDYTSLLTGPGTSMLAGLTAQAGSGTGTLSISGTVATLTIPINTTFMTILAGLPSNVIVTGTLVATATVAPACAADFNHVGGLSVQDIFDFLAAYFSNDPRADFNGVGGISVQDIFDFLAAYFAGCP